MFVILGATGNIGSAVVRALHAAGEPVLAVAHSAKKAKALAVESAVIDVRDVTALRAAFQRGKRAFLLNPPGDPSGDSNSDELATATSIAQALDGSGLDKIVVASTYGAQAGDGIGDLSTLYQFEQLAQASGIAAAINRGAYYFTNLAMLIEPAKAGSLPTPYPKDFVLPMVAPEDLADAAVARLLSPVTDVGVQYVEGPERYSFGQIAAALGDALGRDVQVETTPRGALADSFKAVGFSDVSANAFARMTEKTLEGPQLPGNPRRGRVTLEAFIKTLLA